VAIHVAALDTKVKPKRLAIELSLAGVAAAGGATVVIHPGKAGRSQLNASWTDGTITIGPMTLELGGMRWQSLAIPATGCEAIEQSQLRLRLEDVNDLGDQRPFLVAGASSRSEGTPMPSDHLPRIPLLLPPTMESADGWSTYLNALRKRVGKVVDDRQFTFAKAKVLMPFNGQGDRFRSSVRDELAALLRVNNLPKGNPDELPYGHADFQNPQVGWPTDSMADLNEHPILAFGWRAFAWGADDDLGRRLENLLNKMLTADRKLRRPALVPLLIIGDFDRASDKERDAIDRRWLEHGLRLAAAGVPVIDLRSAQSEPTTDQVQRAAAALLADGLRQLDWLLKR